MEHIAVDKQPLTRGKNGLLTLYIKFYLPGGDQTELKFPVPVPAYKAQHVFSEHGFIDCHGEVKGAVGCGLLLGAVDGDVVDLHVRASMGCLLCGHRMIGSKHDQS